MPNIDNELKLNNPTSIYTIIGLSLTIIWMVIIALLFIPRYSEFIELSLNEIGDFFAGIFAPIAFLWLVLGYLQQSHEIRQNTEALKLQVIELQQQVSNTKDIANNSVTQTQITKLSLDNQIRQSWSNFFESLVDRGPLINFTGYTENKSSWVFVFTAHNVTAIDISISSTSGQIEPQKMSIWPSGSYQEFEVGRDESDLNNVGIVITYKTVTGLTGQRKFNFIKESKIMKDEGIYLIDPPPPFKE